MKKNRPLTPEEVAVNKAIAKHYERKDGKRVRPHMRMPSQAQIATYELLYPGQKAILYAAPQRAKMILDHADKWFVKLTLKLDRLQFPELTQGEDTLNQPKKIARRLMAFKMSCTRDQWAALKTSTLNTALTDNVMAALWNLDADFFTSLAGALKHPAEAAKVYRFLLSNRDAVESCKTRADIFRLLQSNGCGHYERGSFYRLCNEIGLPVSQGVSPVAT